jgi:hypothetical protein
LRSSPFGRLWALSLSKQCFFAAIPRFVLRFLAEDAGKRLDHVLDTILATLVDRQTDCAQRTCD